MVLTSPPAPQPSRPGADGDGDGAAVDAYEEAHVHGVYEAIAPHFSATRHKPWPLVSSFLASRAPGSVGLDVGCGNGKNMGVNRDVVMLGCDRSAALVALARDAWCGARYPRRRRRRRGRGDVDVDVDVDNAAATAAAEGSGPRPGLGPGGADDDDNDDDGTGVVIPGADVAVADSLVLPFREASADFAICIAVIHHLSTRERRVDAIRQLLRCIRRGHQGGGGGGGGGDDDDDDSGGKVLVYVWALEQSSSRRGWDEGGEQDLLVPWVMKAPPQKKEKKEKKNKEKKQATRGQKQGKRNGQGQGQGQVQAQVRASEHDDAAEKNSLDRPGGAAGTRSSDSPRAADQPGGGEGGEKLQGDDDHHHIQHQHGHGNTRQQQQQQGRGSEAGADAAASAAAGTAGNDGDSSSKQQGDRHADKTFHRYYHLYRKGELEEEVISAGGKVIKSGYERDNWWVIAG